MFYRIRDKGYETNRWTFGQFKHGRKDQARWAVGGGHAEERGGTFDPTESTYDSFPCDSFFVINHIFTELNNFPFSFSDENKMPEI